MQKILAIDDKQDNLTVIRALVKNLLPDAVVFLAQSGQEGLAVAHRELPDVILLDLIMPEMDGFEVCSKLKADETTRHIPIIILTAVKTDSKSRIKALNKGADAFLTKPIDETELVAQINAMLRVKRAEDKLRLEKQDLEQLVQERTKALWQELTERKRAEKQLQAALAEKVVLLREIHHRVKNNMQVVSSLLGLQSLHIKDDQALKHFEEAQNRIRSMALVHEKLYGSNDFTHVNFGDYLRSLVVELVQAYRVSPAKIQVNLDVDELTITIDQAIPCGLVVNELLSNALKYAFPDPGQAGVITVSLHSRGDGLVELIVSDTGVGLPEAFDLSTVESIGLDLARDIVQRQLRGDIHVERTQGTTFRITFPVNYKDYP
jgi:two-component sensor histidine kinase/AmiR/NasT family two-component response regulator